MLWILEFAEASKMEQLQLKNWISRRVENGKSGQDLLKSLNIDTSKLLEFNKAENQKARESLNLLEPILQKVPKEILTQSQELITQDELETAGFAWDDGGRWLSLTNPVASNELIVVNQSDGSNGKVEGNCGNITYGSGGPNQITS